MRAWHNYAEHVRYSVRLGQGQLLALIATVALCVGARSAVAQSACVGDCDGSGAVSIDEMLIGVNIALGREQLDRCPSFDVNADQQLEINELLAAVVGSLNGCPATATPSTAPTPTPIEFVAAEADFECLRSWTRIRHFRIANARGQLDEALAVARGEAPPPYPVGTIIQLVPGEAIAKRGAGFFPDAHDWEFFVLKATTAGTEILKRGREEVVNIGPPCFACHGAAPQTDFVCENGNGCVALNLPENVIAFLQENDPRCPTATPTPGP